MARGMIHKMSVAWAIIALVATMIACNDDRGYSTDPTHRLAFSADTVSFDTLFTEVSSATYSFLIYNRNSHDLLIKDARLAGGESSPYRVNLDGMAGTAFREVAVRGGDSLYVFVEVTVDPRGQDEPFEVRDSLQFVLESGVMQQVQLRACGQDAIVLRGVCIDRDTCFTGQRPYLIYDSLRVNEAKTLRLEAGARLYFNEGAGLQVYGSLEAVGTQGAPVVFRGARTDRMFAYLPYDRLTAQWGGITLHPGSFDNVFVNCDIHSGKYGIIADNGRVLNYHSKLSMHNTQIHNVEGDALRLTICSAVITNSLFTNAGGHCVNILGGQLTFRHCTMANFYPWSSERGVAVNISNFDEEEQLVYPLIGVNFTNCIVTGSKDDELAGLVLEKTDTVDYSEYARFFFDHSLINSKGEAREPDSLHFAHIVWEHRDSTAYGRSNFRTIDHSNFIYDFHLDSLSCARNIGKYLGGYPRTDYDRDGQPRKEGQTDAGCYQYVLP